MSFAAPAFLLSALAVPALFLAVAALRRRRGGEVAYTNVDLLAGLVEQRGRRWRRIVPPVLLALALLLAAAATARPEARFTTVQRHARVVLLVDVSGSMSARDVEPTRLDAAVAAMRSFLDRVPASVDVGLVQFSFEPEVLERPTADRRLVRESLGYMIPEAGTAIGDALARTVSVVGPGGAIVLLSDGKQTHGTLGALAGAARARAEHVRVDTIALGTPGGALFEAGRYDPVPPDPPLMRAVARETGGRTFTATNAAALAGVYAHLGGTIARRRTTHEIGSWFAAGAAALLVAAAGLGRLWGAALV